VADRLGDAFPGAIGSGWQGDPDAQESLRSAAESMRAAGDPPEEQDFAVHLECDFRVRARTLREASERADEIVDEIAEDDDARDVTWSGISKW